MKKIFTVFFVILTLFCASCAMTSAKTESKEPITFVKIGQYDEDVHIVYCEQTKVIYSISHGHYNKGTMTLLVNADGTPMLWEE